MPNPNRGIQVPHLEMGQRSGNISPLASFSPKGCTGIRLLRVAWTDALAACQQAVGFSYLKNDGDFSKFKRHLPECHPFYINMVCVKADMVDAGGHPSTLTVFDTFGNLPQSFQTNSFDYALLRLDYATVPYEVKELGGSLPVLGDNDVTTNRYLIPKWKPNAEFFSAPIGWLKFVDAGVPVNQVNKTVPFPSGIIINTVDFQVTWVEVPVGCVEFANLGNYQAKVNKTDIKLLGKTYTPHTLLLTAYEMSDSYFNVVGLRCCDVTFVFKIQLNQHNRLVNFSEAPWAFRRVGTSDGDFTPGAMADGKSIYNEVDMNTMFDTSSL